MRGVLGTITLVMVIALGLDLSGVTSRVDVRWQLFNARLESGPEALSERNIGPVGTFPVHLRFSEGQALVAKIDPHGLLATLRLEFSYEGGPLFIVTPDGEEIALDQESPQCLAEGGSRRTCTLIVHVTDPRPSRLSIAPSTGDVRVTNVGVTTAQVKQASLMSGNLIYVVFVALIVLGPLFVWARRVARMEGVLLTAAAVGWMAFVSVPVFLAICVLLGVSASVLVWLTRRERKDNTALIVASLVVLAVLLGAVKMCLPYLGRVFADPGKMWFALPLGFSYFVIKLVDLLLQVHARALKRVDVREFIEFMVFPPTLAAGPIMTLDDYRKGQIADYGITHWAAGAARFFLGAVKKLFADTFVYPLVVAGSGSFILDPMGTTGAAVAGFLLATTVYVYLDFSAYSDMAIGCGRAMGWKVPENFDLPLLRQRMRQFWQSWHMTLSNWVFRRVFVVCVMSARSQGIATFASMLAIGLWHRIGLSWSFWAVHHSVMLTYENRLLGGFVKRLDGLVSENPRRLGHYLKTASGVALVWGWVSLGHSFTQFADWRLFLVAYAKGLEALGVLAICLLSGLLVLQAWDRLARRRRGDAAEMVE